MKKVTGYQIREAIKQFEILEATLQNRFQESLRAFPGARIEHFPGDVARDLDVVSQNIAKLQEAQSRYNLMVHLPTGESLCFAIKAIGSLGRMENMWKRVAVPKKETWRLSKNEDVRSKDEVYATPMVSSEEASQQARAAAKRTSALRAGIAVANSTEVLCEDINLDSSLLE